MAVDKKAIAAMSRKKKTKMPKASTKDLKALEVAGVSDDLKQKLFGGFTNSVDDVYKMYMDRRNNGASPHEAYKSVWGHDLSLGIERAMDFVP